MRKDKRKTEEEEIKRYCWECEKEITKHDSCLNYCNGCRLQL